VATATIQTTGSAEKILEADRPAAAERWVVGMICSAQEDRPLRILKNPRFREQFWVMQIT
jgi:hypothetical protein